MGWGWGMLGVQAANCMGSTPTPTPNPAPLPAAADGSIRIYDVYSGTLAKLLRPHSHAVSCLAHAAQGDRALLFR